MSVSCFGFCGCCRRGVCVCLVDVLVCLSREPKVSRAFPLLLHTAVGAFFLSFVLAFVDAVLLKCL